MNAYLKRLFELQTTILLNHTLINLIKFFMKPNETSTLLYYTIIPTREASKKELLKTRKKVPKTYKYEVYAEKFDSKLSIKLHADNLSDIEIYNVVLASSLPSLQQLKSITRIIVTKFRPMPLKVDSKFILLSTKYKDYLEFYQIKKDWQIGHVPTYTASTKQSSNNIKELINKDYESFLIDLSSLNEIYRVFSKILIDVYQSNDTKYYSNRTKTHSMVINYSEEYGISASIENAVDQVFYQELIPLKDFHPANSHFIKKGQLYDDIVFCTRYSLAQKNK